MGADPNLPGTWLDYTGTAWDFALQYKNAEILDIFREFDKTGKVPPSAVLTNTLTMTGGKFGRQTRSITSSTYICQSLTTFSRCSYDCRHPGLDLGHLDWSRKPAYEGKGIEKSYRALEKVVQS